MCVVLLLILALIQAQSPRPEKNPLEGNALAITNGGAMSRNGCAGCQGPDARGFPGPDLTGEGESGSPDARLFDIVRKGVPGTEMPGAPDVQRVPDRDIWQVLAYLRTLSAVPNVVQTGDAASGERIFRATCSGCHMVNGRGGQLGPGLSRIGAARPRAGLTAKGRGANAFIPPGHEPLSLVTRTREPSRGIRKDKDEFSIHVLD